MYLSVEVDVMLQEAAMAKLAASEAATFVSHQCIQVCLIVSNNFLNKNQTNNNYSETHRFRFILSFFISSFLCSCILCLKRTFFF